MKVKTTAVLLTFFFGGLGVHRFYLGEDFKGFLYLIFCWTLIPCIFALIDFIFLIVMSDEEFNRKYNKNLIIMEARQVADSNTAISNLDELKKLYELKEMGIITQEEFDLKKKTLL